MNKLESLQILRNNPIFWSRLGLGIVTPEHPHVMPGKDLCKYTRFHDAFCDAGVPIHTCILPSGWYQDGVYDYDMTDQVLDAVLGSGKVSYFFPRIKLNVPVDWCKNHPEDVLVYFNGPRKAEEIQSLVGSLSHDILGYDSEMGYYIPGSNGAQRPNVNGTIALQSFSSRQWLMDAGEALRRLIRHLEDGPYADRIIGYQFAYGTSGESMLWGRDSGRFADYGINNQKEFFAWYKANIDIHAIWEDGDFVPSPEEKYRYGNDLSTQFRDKEKDKKAIAYDTFMTEVNVNAMEYFGKIVKEESGKLSGAFYGYLLHVSRSAYTGFLGWHKILESENVDFFAAPKSYYRSGFGESGGEMAPFYSINKKALWVDECDIRTHLSSDSIGGVAKNMSQTRYMLWREYMKNTAHNSGCWWMDLGDGWYDDEEIMQEVARISRFNHSIKKKAHQTRADVLYAVDEESFKYADDRFNQQILEGNLRQLQHAGCAINVCLQSDLSHLDLTPYKLIVFANAFCMTKTELQKLEEKTNAAFLFGYASGLCQETTDLTNCQALTGFRYTTEEGTPAVIQADGNQERYFINTRIPADISYFREICEKSGCHMYAPEHTFVYTDNRVLGVFGSEPLEIELNLRNTSTLRNVLTGEVFQNVKKLNLNLEQCFAVFEIIEQEVPYES